MARVKVGTARGVERPGTASGRSPEPPFDERERTRRWIAIAIFAPLSGAVLIAVVALAFGKLTVGEVKELLGSLNLSTIVGLATGYLFGRGTK